MRDMDTWVGERSKTAATKTTQVLHIQFFKVDYLMERRWHHGFTGGASN